MACWRAGQKPNNHSVPIVTQEKVLLSVIDYNYYNYHHDHDHDHHVTIVHGYLVFKRVHF